MANNFNENTIYIGSDEVGKIEPLRRLVFVSAYVDAKHLDKLHALGADRDSKKFKNVNAPAVRVAGQELTDFKEFEDCKDGIYKNEAYGITYAVCTISNREFNKLDEKMNENAILSLYHNRVNLMLYTALKEQGIQAEYIVIDNYMGENFKLFDDYLADIDEVNINKDIAAKVLFEKKAESSYPAVACASVIGTYIEQLWHEKFRAQLREAGGNADCLTFGNTISGVDVEFAELKRVYGSLDAPEVDIRHTAHYKRHMK